MPPLFTRTSILFFQAQASSVFFINDVSPEERSNGRTIISPLESLAKSDLSFSNSSTRLEDKIRWAPSFAYCCTNAFPIPEEAPVIQTIGRLDVAFGVIVLGVIYKSYLYNLVNYRE